MERSPSTPPTLRALREPAIRRTLLTILALNALVVGVKLAIGIRTNSLSVLGASLESSLDLLNNVMGIALVRLAATDPDEGHPYGHEKFETLGALGIVVFLSVTCFELLRQGVASVLGGRSPRPPSNEELVLIAATLVINIFIVGYERRRARELGSPFLLADSAHTQSDIYVTAAAIASLVLTRFGLGAVDPVLAIIVGLVIAWHGVEIIRGTIPILVDARAVDPADIRRIIESIPRIAGVRTVRSRASATGRLFAEVTIVVDGAISVSDAHALADEVEAHIESALGHSEVSVHVEPA